MTIEKLRDILVETLGCEPDDVTPEASLADDLGADSLAVVELLMVLEENTELHIEESDAAQMKTVQDVLTYLDAHLA